MQRKALTPNDFADLEQAELRPWLYEELSKGQPRPFDWKFTEADLADLLRRHAAKEAEASLPDGTKDAS